MAEPQTLSLSTFTERKRIRIDGVTYEVRNHGELSVLATKRMTALWNRTQELESLPEPTAEDEAEHLKVSQDYAAAMLIDLPEAVQRKLKVSDVVNIASVFMGLPLAVIQAGATAATETTASPSKKSTGKKLRQH